MNICISLPIEKTKEGLDLIEKANKLADWIELRLDGWEDVSAENLKKLINAVNGKSIVTTKGENHKTLIPLALECGASFVDIPFEDQTSIGVDPKRAILSYHNSTNTESLQALNHLKDRMKKLKTRYMKIVTFAKNLCDNLIIRDFLSANKDDSLISFCMGPSGTVSRYFATTWGSALTFASLSDSLKTALGQVPASFLKRHAITSQTDVFGIIGSHVESSLSPLLHQFAYEHFGIDAIYLPFHVEPENLKNAIDFMRLFPVKGYSVTMPHKKTSMEYADQIEPLAEVIGSINTLVNRDEELFGYNTDVDGAILALEEVTELKGKKVIVLGSGGSARAVVFGLLQRGANVTVLARRIDTSFSCPCYLLSSLEAEIKGADILINTTSVGMAPDVDQTLVPQKFLKDLIVFDLVYAPQTTLLLKQAKENGCQVIGGLRMLILQAVRQIELMTGKRIDPKILELKRDSYVVK